MADCKCRAVTRFQLLTFVFSFLLSYDRFHDLSWGLVAGMYGWWYIAYYVIRYAFHWWR